GLEAGLVYREALADPTYEALWPMLGDAISHDGVPADAALLDAASSRAGSDDVERRLRRQALELRTAGIEGAHQVAGFGYVGSCDGSGAFPLFIARERPDGSFSVINLLFRTTGELRDGFAARFEERAEIESLRETMRVQAASDLLEVPIGVIAALARQHLALAEERGELSGELEELAWRARRFPADEQALDEPSPADEDVSVERARELLAHPHCEYWFLDIPDIIDAGVEAPDNVVGPPDEAWYEAALSRLAQASETIDRAASLAEHTARWHALAGDADLAAEFARLGHMTREEPAHSPLVRVMLEKGLRIARGVEERSDMDIEPLEAADDPRLRREMRKRFFGELDEPTGLDVVHLAMTCASYVLLEALQPAIAASRQPRPEQLYELAFDVGERIADYLTGPPESSSVDLPSLIAQRLIEAGLARADLARVLPAFLNEMEIYFDFVAPYEFFEATRAPQNSMADAFYE
ncbi:MAG: hypothetical protein ACOC9W_01315, partial [Persicimonas sp.]